MTQPDAHSAAAALPPLIGPSRRDADRIVPPTGFTASLTLFAAGAMAFLAVFALALSLASGRLAARWSEALAQAATVRISAAPNQLDTLTERALEVLRTTPGIAAARVIGRQEELALITPWLGPDVPLDELPVPRLIEVVEDGTGVDVEGLRLRLAGEVPGAIYDDHTRWREPLVAAAARLRLLALASIALIAATVAAMVTLAAQAALAANAQVIGVLRLLGARDSYIAGAFTRRFGLRALVGAGVGTLAGMAGVMLLPELQAEGAFLTGLGFSGLSVLSPLVIPPGVGAVAWAATRAAAQRMLREMP